MKFLFTADWHFSRYAQDRIEKDTHLPERLYDLTKVIRQMADYCVENQIPNMIIGGDLLHGKSIIYSLAQALLIDFFSTYKTIHFYIIDGNHDLSGKGSNEVSALKSLDNIENVTRIERCGQIENIYFVPYSSEMMELIRKPPKGAQCLISHFGLNEGVLNSGLSMPADIGLSALRKKYDLVLLGHYHKPQEIHESSISVYYVGSPIQLTWGERDEEKRFLIVDTDNPSIESVPTMGYRRYLEFELTESNKPEVIKMATKAQEEGHHVNIKKVEKVDTSDIQGNFRIVDRTEKDITDRGLSISMSTEDKLKRYIEIREIPESKRDLYLRVAERLIEVSEGDTTQ